MLVFKWTVFKVFLLVFKRIMIMMIVTEMHLTNKPLVAVGR